jgi:hypothetical protein
MKKLFATLVLSGLAVPVLAGGEQCASEAKSSCATLASFRCENKCPLAEKANYLRAYGLEAVAVSTVVRDEMADALEANLARI